jgi:hypothetical protein
MEAVLCVCIIILLASRWPATQPGGHCFLKVVVNEPWGRFPSQGKGGWGPHMIRKHLICQYEDLAGPFQQGSTRIGVITLGAGWMVWRTTRARLHGPTLLAMGRCKKEGCSKATVPGGTPHCKLHGGGKRCKEEGCDKLAPGNQDHCKQHGGGRRCQHEGCNKAAAAGGTEHCKAHGGGRRCTHDGCSKVSPGLPRAALRRVWV